MRGLYFDNSTAAKPSRRVINAMLPFYTDFWGVASAPHWGGHELMGAISDSYKAIYRFLGASEEDTFVLTSSGTEAINQVFHSLYWGVSRLGGAKEYVTIATEEASTLMAISRLEALGCRGVMAPLNAQGNLSPETIDTIIGSQTALVSLSWADGLTGIIHPIAEIAALCSKKGVPLHVDATHILGKLSFRLCDLPIDYLTFNGEQLHTPKGCAGLFFRSGSIAHPLIVGSVEQNCLRAGNLNLPTLIALAEACREADEERDFVCMESARLRNRLEVGLIESCPSASLLFSHLERLPHITTIAFPGIVNEAFLFLLNRHKVFASIGGGSFQQLALVARTRGVPAEIAHTALSFSLSRETTDDEIDRAIAICKEIFTSKCVIA